MLVQSLYSDLHTGICLPSKKKKDFLAEVSLICVRFCVFSNDADSLIAGLIVNDAFDCV